MGGPRSQQRPIPMPSPAYSQRQPRPPMGAGGPAHLQHAYWDPRYSQDSRYVNGGPSSPYAWSYPPSYQSPGQQHQLHAYAFGEDESPSPVYDPSQFAGAGQPVPQSPPYGDTPPCYPGAPIQTERDGKVLTCGPEGSNLFVFHIPNEMTNLDLHKLFLPYGPILSVRVMVDKTTGRSRGYGFVSFEDRDSAEAAIKHLNGHKIGTKRLKVQHKRGEEQAVAELDRKKSADSCPQQPQAQAQVQQSPSPPPPEESEAEAESAAGPAADAVGDSARPAVSPQRPRSPAASTTSSSGSSGSGDGSDRRAAPVQVNNRQRWAYAPPPPSPPVHVHAAYSAPTGRGWGGGGHQPRTPPHTHGHVYTPAPTQWQCYPTAYYPPDGMVAPAPPPHMGQGGMYHQAAPTYTPHMYAYGPHHYG